MPSPVAHAVVVSGRMASHGRPLGRRHSISVPTLQVAGCEAGVGEPIPGFNVGASGPSGSSGVGKPAVGGIAFDGADGGSEFVGILRSWSF
jgi:hypothetical protein